MASAAASQSTPLFWTPETRKELARKLHSDMLTFQNDIAKVRTKYPDKYKAWVQFRDAWARWYGDAGLTTWLWDATVSTIEGYANQLNKWLAWLASEGVPSSGVGPVALQTYTPGKLETEGKQKLDVDWKPVIWAGGAIAAGVIGYFVWSKSKKKGLDGLSEHSKLDVELVDLDAGGYDARGTYWGKGAKLYRVTSAVGVDDAVDYYVRAKSPADALKKTVWGALRQRRAWGITGPLRGLSSTTKTLTELSPQELIQLSKTTDNRLLAKAASLLASAKEAQAVGDTKLAAQYWERAKTAWYKSRGAEEDQVKDAMRQQRKIKGLGEMDLYSQKWLKQSQQLQAQVRTLEQQFRKRTWR